MGRDVAASAGDGNPVLDHLVRSARAAKRCKAAQRGRSGRLVVAEDLLQPSAGNAR
ncbi:hypothetical protein [Streptomyces kurssanovii]|uniref:Transposase n=1 Tax=Streptomyces kurssanovii TaxID=67312 RepID=A0ABV3HUF0_9ACTN